MRHITSTFLRGLGVILPIVLTIWIVVGLAMGTEALLRPIFLVFLPDAYYLPGLGLVFGLVVVYAVGVLVQVFVIARLWEALRRLFERIPLVKTVYTAISDFFEFFSRGSSEGGSTVVSVEIADGASLIGFVTDTSPTLIDVADAGRIAVYLPMSYQIGGYTLLVSRDRVTPLDLAPEEAMRLVLTAAIRGRS
ncbi:MAG: DUF502 domain-containing protein [Gammaproteobacteria bacterium]|nr:DUF502 domain-containing protein [Gammaproteobacteria bacterium]